VVNVKENRMRIAATLFLLLVPMLVRAQEASVAAVAEGSTTDVILPGPPAWIVADRPGLADGPTTVDFMVAQLEIGVTGEGGDEERVAIPALLRYGITDRLELRIASDIFSWTSDRGDFGPVAAGFKLRLREGELPLSLIASVQPPSGGGSLRTTAFESEARLVSEIGLAERLSLTPNLGLALVEGGDATAIFAATLERDLGNLLPFVDFETSFGSGETSMIADFGVAWLVWPEMQLDLSAGIDVVGSAYPEWFIAAGYNHQY
jgi:hypothetical protein